MCAHVCDARIGAQMSNDAHKRSPVAVWVCTFLADSVALDDLKMHLATHCNRYTFQLEEAASGVRYYLCRVHLKTKRRMGAVLSSTLNNFGMSLIGSAGENGGVDIFNAGKRVGGPWTEKDGCTSANPSAVAGVGMDQQLQAQPPPPPPLPLVQSGSHLQAQPPPPPPLPLQQSGSNGRDRVHGPTPPLPPSREEETGDACHCVWHGTKDDESLHQTVAAMTEYLRVHRQCRLCDELVRVTTEADMKSRSNATDIGAESAPASMRTTQAKAIWKLEVGNEVQIAATTVGQSWLDDHHELTQWGAANVLRISHDVVNKALRKWEGVGESKDPCEHCLSSNTDCVTNIGEYAPNLVTSVRRMFRCVFACMLSVN